jgi:hypothetical protein
MKTPLYQCAPASRGGTFAGRRISAAIATLLCSLYSGISQGTFTVNFDGLPLRPPGTQDSARYYEESGVWFRPMPGTYFDSFTRNGGGIVGYPDNGTAYL